MLGQKPHTQAVQCVACLPDWALCWGKNTINERPIALNLILVSALPQAEQLQASAQIAALQQQIKDHIAAAATALSERQAVVAALLEEESGKAAAALVARDAFWKGSLACRGGRGRRLGRRFSRWGSKGVLSRVCTRKQV